MWHDSNKNGSIMIAALVVTLITGALVGLFLKTVTQEIQNSYRSRMSFQAVNLAEAGLDYAMYAMIEDDWDSWQEGAQGGYLRASFPDVSISWRNESRSVIVYVEPDADPVPRAIAEGTITTKSGITVQRQIYVEMNKGPSQDPTDGGFWGNGILGKRGINLGGNKQMVDSFSSSDNPLGYSDINDIYNAQVSTTILGHDLAKGNGSVASLSVKVTDISVGNADIYGSLATGAGSEVDIGSVVGPNGSIYNEETKSGSETFIDDIDYAFVGYEFYANLPDPVAPDLGEDVETSYSGNTIGVAGQETEYRLSSMNLKNKDTVTIKGKVTLVVDGDITVGGALLLDTDAELELYVNGNMDIGGTGIVNTNKPANLLIYNTGKNNEMKLHGNGALSAAVYAPNSTVSLRGGGNSGVMYGAVVGDTVTFSGNNYDFHYDEDLANIGDEDDDEDPGNFTPEVSRWVELTAQDDRYDMSTILTDGL
jgi:hypothetical protein